MSDVGNKQWRTWIVNWLQLHVNAQNAKLPRWSVSFAQFFGHILISYDRFDIII